MPTDLLVSPSLLPFYTRGRTLDCTNTYNGSLLTFLATGLDTAGRSAMIEFEGRPGDELPPFALQWEQATYFVLAGRLDFHCAGHMRELPAGTLAFAPQGAPHAFRIRSPQARVLVSVQAVGEQAVGLDQFWIAASSLVTRLTLPLRHASDNPADARHLGALHGLHFLTPTETAVALPHYTAPPTAGPDDDETDPRWNPSGWVMEVPEPAAVHQHQAVLGLTSHETNR